MKGSCSPLPTWKGGDADSWRASFLRKATTLTEDPNFGTWKDFLQKLQDSFKPYDLKGEALDKIIKLWQGTTSIKDHIVKFKVLLSDSGVAEDSPAGLNYFQKSIRVLLLRKILDWDDVPDTLADWYKKVLKTNNNYHRVQRILKWDAPKKEEGKPRWNFWKEKGDITMDMDVITRVYKTMTDKEKTELMKKGLCFHCKKARHLSWDCPEKKGKGATPATPATTSTSATPTKKMMAKELTAYIWSLMALLNDEEKTVFYDEAEKEGF